MANCGFDSKNKKSKFIAYKMGAAHTENIFCAAKNFYLVGKKNIFFKFISQPKEVGNRRERCRDQNVLDL